MNSYCLSRSILCDSCANHEINFIYMIYIYFYFKPEIEELSKYYPSLKYG
ncbi:hypothetical protein C427_5230 [Paraglaciecola psychrophila 170]|uniref:Uncharacterized protein n=1 Tax=Paraglaciecola psychrophila 170 TaxID=1129794 RepID=K6ZKN7_9ALTE|nr:hypothetical protein C427_5230 [Paraglaciecola psychrophila 170]GAC36541.1 hypothetical protein GPSY_0903 [Paraglaciecola psychrophila 170]